ncbi:MAG: hypothetical protein ACR2P1_03320 [Pseudomonadales bacterium]
MIRQAISITLILLFMIADASSGPVELKDGYVQSRPNGMFRAWDAENEVWLKPAKFWQRYAARRGGLTWGPRSDYPPYEQVKEFDTLLIELESGPCLMEFFHSRWRRANDVRRWDEKFNEYGGCPNVFD